MRGWSIRKCRILFGIVFITYLALPKLYALPINRFEEVWRRYQDYMELGDEERAEAEFSRLNRLRVERGIENLIPYSSLLIKEGDRYLKNGDYKRAYRSYIRAIILSPDLYKTYFSLAKFYWVKKGLNFFNIVDNILTGIMLYLKDPLNRLRILSNLSSSTLIGFALSSFILTILIFFKHSRPLIHDLRELLPKDLPMISVFFIILTISIIPIILGKGVIPLFIFWLITLTFYLKDKESIMVGMISVVLLFTPFLFIFLSLSPLLFEKSIYGVVTRVNRGGFDFGDKERLEKFVRENPEEELALFSLALVNRRFGLKEEALEIYRRLLALNPDFLDKIYNNIGNILYLKGEIERSIHNYLKALEISPNSAVFHFNLGLALRDKMRILDAERELKKARELAPSLVNKYLEYNIPIDDRIPLKKVISLKRFKDIMPYKFRRYMGSGVIWVNLLFSGIIFIYLLLIKRFKEGFGPSNSCMKCGNIICMRCKNSSKDKRLCLSCFNLYRGNRIEERMRDLKLREIEDYQRIRRIKEELLLLFIPGGLPVMRDFIGRGFLILFVFSTLLIEIFLWDGNIYMLFVFMLIVTYMYSVLYSLRIKG